MLDLCDFAALNDSGWIMTDYVDDGYAWKEEDE